LSCLPAGVVPQADGEFPTRLRFLASSWTTVRMATPGGSFTGQRSITGLLQSFKRHWKDRQFRV
jgi:hypothetical protein